MGKINRAVYFQTNIKKLKEELLNGSNEQKTRGSIFFADLNNNTTVDAEDFTNKDISDAVKNAGLFGQEWSSTIVGNVLS